MKLVNQSLRKSRKLFVDEHRFYHYRRTKTTLIQFFVFGFQLGLLSKHLLTYSLCGLLLVGQVPALWHASTCDDGCWETGTHSGLNTSCCSCPCGDHSDSEFPTLSWLQGNDSEGGPSDHDSESCVICRSLHAPNAALYLGLCQHEVTDSASELPVQGTQSAIKEIHALSQPRAPPVA